MFKKGAITITHDPLEVRWFGALVPLSPGEAHLFTAVAVRGKLSFPQVDAALEDFGVKRRNRGIVILRTRRKFAAIGACDPYEVLPKYGLRLCVDPDASQSTQTWIGLRSD